MNKDDKIKPEDIMNFDENGNLVYSRDLFLTLAMGDMDNIILEYPELLKIVWRGVKDLFKTYEKYSNALELCSLSLLNFATTSKWHEIYGIDISNLTPGGDRDIVTPEFKEAYLKLYDKMLSMAEDNKDLLHEEN